MVITPKSGDYKYFQILVDNATKEEALHLLKKAIKEIESGCTVLSEHPNNDCPYLGINMGITSRERIERRKAKEK